MLVQRYPHSSRRNAGTTAANWAWLRALERTAAITRDTTLTLPGIIDGLAERHGAAPALLSEEETLTFAGLAERVNRYARWALEIRISEGDVVALLMPNCPTYMAAWLGVTRVRGVVALINTNLVGASLAHAINVAAPRHIIVAAEFAPAVLAVRSQLAADLVIWSFGAETAGLPRLDREVECVPGHGLTAAECPPPSAADRALYIYTSGTTGLPKAAIVSHHRLLVWSQWFGGLMDTKPGDRMYNCLPMYHSVGGVVAAGATLVNGGSVVLRRRFSAAQFWQDVVRWDCTLFQYIGELCRYLVNTPPTPFEAQHRIRLCCGNGLQGDVWQQFKARFGIPSILEFYAATEGTFSLYNVDEEPGSIGRIPSFMAHRSPVALVRFDIDAGGPVRGDDGFCIRAAVDEAGEAIGRIAGDVSGRAGALRDTRTRRRPRARFYGMCSRPATPGSAPVT